MVAKGVESLQNWDRGPWWPQGSQWSKPPAKLPRLVQIEAIFTFHTHGLVYGSVHEIFGLVCQTSSDRLFKRWGRLIRRSLDQGQYLNRQSRLFREDLGHPDGASSRNYRRHCKKRCRVQGPQKYLDDELRWDHWGYQRMRSHH